MSHDVFISYSSKDKPIADATCAVLEQKGIRCWIAPRDILPGADWGESIINAIGSVRAFVLVFSRNANESVQIKREVERAVNRGLPVIPMRVEDVAPTKSLEFFISTPHWLDAYSPPLERHLEYLATVIEQILEGKPAPPPRPVPVPPKIYGIDRRYVFAGAGALVLLVIAGLWFLMGGGSPPSLTGKWKTDSVTLNGDPLPPAVTAFSTTPFAEAAMQNGRLSGDWEQQKLGGYAATMRAEDHGSVRAVGGGFVFVSDVTHRPTSFSVIAVPPAQTSSFAVQLGGEQGDGAIALTTPGYGQATLVGRSSGASGALAMIAGHWSARLSQGSSWAASILDVDAGGTYRYTLELHEAGILQAADGKWTRTPNGGAPVSGTYEFDGSDTVTFADQTGTTVWKRAE